MECPCTQLRYSSYGLTRGMPDAIVLDMLSHQWMVGALVLLATASAGCSSENDNKGPGTGGGGAGGSSGASMCDTVSPTEIETALGLSSIGSPEASSEDPVTVCSYDRVLIRYEKGMSPSSFDAYPELYQEMFGEGGKLTEVPGIGDRAFTRPVSGMTELLALKGRTCVQIVAFDASLEQISNLMREILARL